MKIPPPFQVPGLIVSSYPELLLVAESPQTAVKQYLSVAEDLGDFQQNLQQQGAPSTSGGWATVVPMDGGGSRLDLSGETLKALPHLLSQVLNPVMNDEALKGICWTVQQGVVPGRENVDSAKGEWKLSTLNPSHALVINPVSYSMTDRSISLHVTNKMARHLGVYARFFNSGTEVIPAGWVSRLPQGVPSVYESGKLSYLSILPPSTPVAGIDVGSKGKEITFTLPKNTNAVEIVFGGIGNGQWDAMADSAGALLTYVFDYVIPMIISQEHQDVSSLPELPLWFAKLIDDEQVIAEILSAGNSVVHDPDITDLSSLLGVFAQRIPSLMLDDRLKPLKKSIDKVVGDDAVKNAVSILGWPAATLQALVDTQTASDQTLNQTNSRLLGVPATTLLKIWPAMVLEVQVNLETPNGWRAQATKYTVRIEYAHGFSQTQGGSINPLSAAVPLIVNFPAVRNLGKILVSVSIFNAAENCIASGSASVEQPATLSERVIEVTPDIIDRPVVVDKNTQYEHGGTLIFRDNAYVWDSAIPQPSATKLSGESASPGAGAVTQMLSISLQNQSRCLGYVWRASGQSVQSCYGGASISHACLMQNIGTVRAGLQLKTVNCGFVQQPCLVYGEVDQQAAGFFVDPKDSGFYLRDVDFSSGSFKLNATKSRGKLREVPLSGVAIHPAGFVVAVSELNNRLEIVRLSPQAVADANAPISLLSAGTGSRAGLLDSPVAIDVTPQGFLLVLEQGNSRLQAFDIHANPVSLFNQSPFIMLKQGEDIRYLDLAISPAGYIYILSSKNGGALAADFSLDVYASDGSHLANTSGVNAAKIAVDEFETVYSLNYETIVGPNGRCEPSLSTWKPVANK